MNMISKEELQKLAIRKLWHGEYVATDNFKSIEKHASVCFEDGGLVAVTGKADDRESQLYAAMFADAPAMLLEVAELRSDRAELVAFVKDAYEWFGRFCVDSPITFGGELELGERAEKLLAKVSK